MKITINIDTDNESFQSEEGSFLKFDHSQLEKVIDTVRDSILEYNLDYDYNNAVFDLNGNLIGSIKISPPLKIKKRS